jgi:hypothetical protein
VYSQLQEGFWCCVGSGLENHGKYGELIYAHRGSQQLLVNLFIPSRLDWPSAGVALTQRTRFPFAETTQLQLKLKKPRKFALSIRQPGWVPAGQLKVLVNGQPTTTSPAAPGYVTIERSWKSGDEVTVALPMQTTAEYLPDHSPWVSFVHGPIVLAAATDTTDQTGLRADGSRMGHVANGPLYAIDEAPVLVVAAPDQLVAGIRPVAGKPLTFTAASLIDAPKYRDVQLVPFYQLHDTRYMVYWPVTTPEGLVARKQAIRQKDEEKLALDARTVDKVAPGEQQPESDHGFVGEQTETGVFRDRHWRHAKGWFSYRLNNPKAEARTLRVTYYGGDQGRRFSILVNGQLLTTVASDSNRGPRFYDVDYPLPESAQAGAASKVLEVKFAAQPGSIAGGIYDVRLLK